MDPEMKNHLWEFEIQTNKFAPIAVEVHCDYEPQYQRARENKSETHQFTTFEKRQLNGSPQEFEYLIVLNLKDYDNDPQHVIGYQMNKATSKRRILRRQKDWKNSDTNYPSDPWVNQATGVPHPRP